jgi:hypothetical protein
VFPYAREGFRESVKAVFTPLVKNHWDAFFMNIKSLGQWVEIAYVRT